jgi:hypothetical protein
MSDVRTLALLSIEEDERGNLTLRNHGGPDVRIEAADVPMLRAHLSRLPELHKHRGRTGSW